MGLLRSDIEDIQSGDITLIGLPFDQNSSFLQGPAKAPELVIEAIESPSANYFTENLTDLDEHPSIKWCGNASFSGYLEIEEALEGILRRGGTPFSLGGDHSVTYPVLKAVAKHHSPIHIIHFDAHGDLYDELDGNRLSHACPFARIMEDGLANRLTQVGIRTMTAHQKEQVERFGVEVIQMKELKSDLVLSSDLPIYISFDLDVLDPAFAPGVSHHEPGGLSTREAIRLIQQLKGNIIGCDLVEYNPERDINGVTAMVAAKIVKEMLEKLI